jgi:hypothetical protein
MGDDEYTLISIKKSTKNYLKMLCDSEGHTYDFQIKILIDSYNYVTKEGYNR